jgi:hypothetical protein
VSQNVAIWISTTVALAIAVSNQVAESWRRGREAKRKRQATILILNIYGSELIISVKKLLERYSSVHSPIIFGSESEAKNFPSSQAARVVAGSIKLPLPADLSVLGGMQGSTTVWYEVVKSVAIYNREVDSSIGMNFEFVDRLRTIEKAFEAMSNSPQRPDSQA